MHGQALLACNPLPTSFPALTLLTYWVTFCVTFHLTNTGIEKMQYGYSSAVGLFNSVVGTILLFVSNYASRKLTDTGVV